MITQDEFHESLERLKIKIKCTQALHHKCGLQREDFIVNLPDVQTPLLFLKGIPITDAPSIGAWFDTKQQALFKRKKNRSLETSKQISCYAKIISCWV